MQTQSKIYRVRMKMNKFVYVFSNNIKTCFGFGFAQLHRNSSCLHIQTNRLYVCNVHSVAFNTHMLEYEWHSWRKALILQQQQKNKQSIVENRFVTKSQLRVD